MIYLKVWNNIVPIFKHLMVRQFRIYTYIHNPMLILNIPVEAKRL